jgi:hypothetical protein
MNREKNLMKYSFASILLLASFLMAVPANQYQSISAQTEGEEAQDNQQNVTEAEAEENATDVEIPEFENGTAAFVPPPDREAPPVPADAIKGADIPDEQPPEDTDSQPLSVSNRTELLEVLPSNSSKIIEHVDEDLKNSTGEGLLPPAILDKIISGEGQGNDTILDISTPEELDEIKNFSEVTTNQTTEEALEEGEPISISNVTNATDTETVAEEQDGEEEQALAGAEGNMTNATGGGEEQQQEQDEEDTEDGEEQEEGQAGAEGNMTNATGGGEEQQQEQDEEDTEDGEEEQAQATEAVNLTNATGGEMTNMTNATGGGEEQQQEQDEEDTEDGEEQEEGQAGAGQQQEEDTEDGEEQEQGQAGAGQQQEEDTEDGEEQEQAVTNATNATMTQPREGVFNTTNVTSMLNATGLDDETEDAEDSPEDESEDE